MCEKGHCISNCLAFTLGRYKKRLTDGDGIFSRQLTHINTYSLIQFKGYNPKFKFFDGVQFGKYFISLLAFFLIIWLIESPKNFEKTSILKI